MNLIRFIGDVHGKYEPYKKLIAAGQPKSIQVGDMGVGFRKMQGPNTGAEYGNPPHYLMVEGGHRFIRGNHDNPASCRKHSQWIADGHIENNIMFIGGAISVDRQWRVKDYSYWEDEELSVPELDALVEKYLEVKPEIMVTHDAPEDIAEIVMVDQLGITGFYRGQKLDPEFKSNSRIAFQRMLSGHSPKLWIFGHWHHSFDKEIRGTRFLCLNELEFKDIDVSSV